MDQKCPICDVTYQMQLDYADSCRIRNDLQKRNETLEKELAQLKQEADRLRSDCEYIRRTRTIARERYEALKNVLLKVGKERDIWKEKALSLPSPQPDSLARELEEAKGTIEAFRNELNTRNESYRSLNESYNKQADRANTGWSKVCELETRLRNETAHHLEDYQDLTRRYETEKDRADRGWAKVALLEKYLLVCEQSGVTVKELTSENTELKKELNQLRNSQNQDAVRAVGKTYLALQGLYELEVALKSSQDMYLELQKDYLALKRDSLNKRNPDRSYFVVGKSITSIKAGDLSRGYVFIEDACKAKEPGDEVFVMNIFFEDLNYSDD